MRITAQSFKSKRVALCGLCVFASNPNVYDAIAACRCFRQPPLAAHLPFNWRQGLCASYLPRCRPKARYGQQAATCSVNTVQVAYFTRLRTDTDVLTSPRVCSARNALLDVHFYILWQAYGLECILWQADGLECLYQQHVLYPGICEQAACIPA